MLSGVKNSVDPVVKLWKLVRYWLHTHMPKGLFARAIVMILLPLIMVQLILFWVFYDRLWESVIWRFSSSISGDIAHIISIIEREPHNALLVTEDTQNLRMTFQFKPNTSIPAVAESSTLLAKKMRLALDEYIPQYSSKVDVSSAPEKMFVYVQMGTRLMEVSVYKTRFNATSPSILFGWILLSSVLLAFISSIFMRNQVRPIGTLAIAMERLGRGNAVTMSIKPKGALEVRQAGHAFNKMRNRIVRQVRHRTDMLSGISHDLRTPLTRMRLQLSMMEKNQANLDLLNDIAEMEAMITAYLNFAKGEGKESLEQVNISTLLATLCRDWQRQGKLVSSSIVPNIVTSLKPNAIRRCINNLISNSCKFAQQVHVAMGLNDKQDTIIIHVDDNGPGIPQAERDAIFRPFRRLENSRHRDTGGIGLGLSITQDIVHNHGGDINLEDSPLGGLRVTIKMPL